MTILLSLACAYVALVLFALIASDTILFPAPKPSYSRDVRGILLLPATTGEEIAAYWMPNPRARYSLLYCHGNGEDIGHIVPLMEEFHRRGFSVFAFDYPGYGASSGRPNEDNVYAAVNAAYAYLTTQLEVAPESIILYGRSLGGGPAVDLASRAPVGGLILDGAFYSAFRVVTAWPIVPFDKFHSGSKISRVDCPILFIHGKRDRTVPFREGQRLYHAAPEPKQRLWIEEAGHNNLIDTARERYWDAILTFRDSLHAEAANATPSNE